MARAAVSGKKHAMSVVNKQNDKPKKSGFRRAVGIVVMIIVIVFLALLAVGLAFLLTDGYGEGALSVECKEITYKENASDLFFADGTEFKVNTMPGIPYNVKIEVNDASGGDFKFTVAGESGYRWTYLAGMDATKAFSIERNESGFKLYYDSLSSVLRYLKGNDAKIPDSEKPGTNLFVMIINTATQEIRLSFGLAPDITDVTIDPPSIVI